VLSFSKERHTLTARDLAATTEIPLPSVYRYLASLRDMGLVYADERGAYRLTARWIALAQAAEAAEPLIDLADPVMRRLGQACGETVLLVQLVSGAAVCVHRIESSHALRISFEVGQPLSLEHGASARLLLSSLPEAVLRKRLDDLAQRDPDAAARLEGQVDEVRRNGWATSEEEIDAGVWAAAAAVRDGEDTLAALSVPSPLVRAPDAVRQELLGQVRAAAQEIGERLREARS
jgi:DNA-binding IclR family transcriptional regulator